MRALSTGMRRVVELGCVLGQQARVLLLDEPTAGLAQRETEAFVPLLQDVRTSSPPPSSWSSTTCRWCSRCPTGWSASPPGRSSPTATRRTSRRTPGVVAAYLGTDERAVARSGPVAAVSRG